MRKLLFIILAFCLSTPVFADMLRIADTDAMTGYLSTSGTGIGQRNNVAADNAYTTLSHVGFYRVGTTYTIKRLLGRWDSSPLPDAYTITGAVIKARIASLDTTQHFYSKMVVANDSSTTIHFNTGKNNEMVGWASAAAMNVTIISDSVYSSAKAVGDTIIYTLNAAGLTKISKTGNTQAYIMAGKDISYTDPEDGASYWSLTDDSIWLEITYTAETGNTGARRQTYPAEISGGQKW